MNFSLILVLIPLTSSLYIKSILISSTSILLIIHKSINKLLNQMNQLFLNRICTYQLSLSISRNSCINCNNLTLLKTFTSLNENVKEMIDIIVLNRANNINEFLGQSIDCILKLQNLLFGNRWTNNI